MKQWLLLLRAAAAVVFVALAGCTGPGPVSLAPRDSYASSTESARAAVERERPGLGTVFGETRDSRVETSSFVRAQPGRPLAVETVFYNDEEGARAMAGADGWRRLHWRPVEVANSLISLAVRDGATRRRLRGFTTGERHYVVGETGQRYTLSVENLTDSRLEIVLSVDGLDVIDGRPASYRKRGYIIGPRGRLEVEGFRRSFGSVAAFRLGSVRDSYASRRHADTRNVGVIGAAVFHERGDDPHRGSGREIRRRGSADPFPNDHRFAWPP